MSSRTSDQVWKIPRTIADGCSSSLYGPCLIITSACSCSATVCRKWCRVQELQLEARGQIEDRHRTRRGRTHTSHTAFVGISGCVSSTIPLVQDNGDCGGIGCPRSRGKRGLVASIDYISNVAYTTHINTSNRGKGMYFVPAVLRMVAYKFVVRNSMMLRYALVCTRL